LGDFFAFGYFLNITKVAQIIWVHLFIVQILTKNGLGDILGDSFSNSSVPPGADIGRKTDFRKARTENQNLSTFQLIDFSTYRLFNLLTFLLIKFSTYWLFYLSTFQLIEFSTYQLFNLSFFSTYRLFNLSTFQLIIFSTYWLFNFSTYRLFNLPTYALTFDIINGLTFRPINLSINFLCR
jgi:hypothetical protein